MILLDLFCKAGGAAKGYADAGFEIIGVDITPQKHYPYEFHQADAFDFLIDHATDFDVIHASPPCQGYSAMNQVHKREYPKLIGRLQSVLRVIGKPYIIENVVGAPLINPITLCGTMFHLAVLRHRLFETNFHVPQPAHGAHIGEFYSPAGHGDPNRRNRARNPHLKGIGYTARCRQAMGIDWMNRDELAEAIPPAYTRHIGSTLVGAL